MESRSSSAGESGGTGEYIDDASNERSATGLYAMEGRCDACPHCMDVCCLKTCPACETKRIAQASRFDRNGEYTMCQVRRHRIRSDCWLVAHKIVYNATPFIKYHPAGIRPILSRAGGDCTTDYDFHSLVAHRQYWKPLRIGRVVECPLGSGGSSFFQTGCTIS